MTRKVESIFSTVTAEGGQCDLGTDQDGNLYVNNKKVVTQQKLNLPIWVNVSIVAGGLATVVIALISVLQALGCIV